MREDHVLAIDSVRWIYERIPASGVVYGMFGKVTTSKERGTLWTVFLR